MLNKVSDDLKGQTTHASRLAALVETKHSEDATDLKKGISDNDLRDMLKLLLRQKEGIEVLKSSVNDSVRQFQVMDRELD